MDRRERRHALHRRPYVHPFRRAVDVEFLAVAGALCVVPCVAGLDRAGDPDLARDRRDRCDLHVSARRACRSGTLGLSRHAGGADLGDPLFGTPAHAGVPVHGGVSRRTDGGGRPPHGAVMAAAAGAGDMGQSARRLRAWVGADRTDRARSALDQRGQGPRGACRALGAVRPRRARGVLLHALWLGHPGGRIENSQPGQAADADLGMDADQFRHLDLLRIFPARTDRPRLPARPEIVGAADHPRAGPDRHGAGTCQKPGDLRLYRSAGPGQAVCRATGNAADRHGSRSRRPGRGRIWLFLPRWRSRLRDGLPPRRSWPIIRHSGS